MAPALRMLTDHSFGADTTLMVSARDPRVDAGLAPASGAIVVKRQLDAGVWPTLDFGL